MVFLEIFGSVLFQEWAKSLVFIFGGCCSTIIALENIVRLLLIPKFQIYIIFFSIYYIPLNKLILNINTKIKNNVLLFLL